MVDNLDKVVTHSWAAENRMVLDDARFHHATQNGTCYSAWHHLKLMNCLFFGIFNVIFLDHVWLQVVETTESKTANKRKLLNMIVLGLFYMILKQFYLIPYPSPKYFVGNEKSCLIGKHQNHPLDICIRTLSVFSKLKTNELNSHKKPT